MEKEEIAAWFGIKSVMATVSLGILNNHRCWDWHPIMYIRNSTMVLLAFIMFQIERPMERMMKRIKRWWLDSLQDPPGIVAFTNNHDPIRSFTNTPCTFLEQRALSIYITCRCGVLTVPGEGLPYQFNPNQAIHPNPAHDG